MVSEPPSKQCTETSLHNFIDGHLRQLQWSAYSLAGLGALIILRRIKATTKFSHVKDIPAHFTAKNYRLQGNVRTVSDTGELYVEHIPILQLKLFSHHVDFVNLLKVNVAGVSITPEAVKWLSVTVLDKHVWFRLLQADDTSLDCDITLKQNWMSRRLSLSEELVKQGLCAVKHYQTPPSSQAYNKFLVHLLSLEYRAQGKAKGLWKSEEYTGKSWLGKATQWLKHRLKNPFKR